MTTLLALLTFVWVDSRTGPGTRRRTRMRTRADRVGPPCENSLPLSGEPHLRVPPAAGHPIPLPFSRWTLCRGNRRRSLYQLALPVPSLAPGLGCLAAFPNSRDSRPHEVRSATLFSGAPAKRRATVLRTLLMYSRTNWAKCILYNGLHKNDGVS